MFFFFCCLFFFLQAEDGIRDLVRSRGLGDVYKRQLNRFPNGITGKSFYQKDVTGKVADWVEKYPYRAEGEDILSLIHI